MKMIETRRIPIESILQSKGRVKVLKIIAEKGELNISEIARCAKVNHNATQGHLKFLVQAGVIQEKRYGRIRIYRFKKEISKVSAIKTLFDIWENSKM